MKLLKLLLCALLLFTGRKVVAQNASLDSLKVLLKTMPEDSARVDVLLEISKNYFYSEPQEAIHYGMLAKELAEKINYKKGLAYALKNVGIGNHIQGKYLEAFDYGEQSLQIFEAINDQVGVSNLLSNIGAIFSDKGDDAKALEYFLKSLEVAEKVKNKSRIATALNNIGTVYYNNPATHDKALQYYLKALPLAEELQDDYSIETISSNLGEIYLALKDDVAALKYFQRSLSVEDNSENAYALNGIGKVYKQRQEPAEAIKYHSRALAIARKTNQQLDVVQSYLGLAQSYMLSKNYTAALSNFRNAKQVGEELKANIELRSVYQGLAKTYASINRYDSAFKYENLLTSIKDTLYNAATDKKVAALQFDFEIQKKQTEINLLKKDKDIQALDLRRQKLARNALFAGLLLVFVIAIILYRNYRNKVKTNKILDQQKIDIENLLLNILPSEVAAELRKNGFATSRYYENVSVLFTDFKSFTKLADALSPQEVVSELNACFVAFDDIIEKYKLEKIKTIGDSYMCAGGIPSASDNHIENIIQAGLEIEAFMHARNAQRKLLGLSPWELRIGIHTGPVVAGVVGRKKYAYDIWGSTVNIASRMESNGEAGHVNISSAVYNRVKHIYNCTYRGKIYAKNVGEVDMYFVNQPKQLTEEIVSYETEELSKQ